MAHITVDDEQARIIAQSGASVEIRDLRGKHLGFVAHEFSESDIAAARHRSASNEPHFTTQQVLDHLHSLKQP